MPVPAWEPAREPAVSLRAMAGMKSREEHSPEPTPRPSRAVETLQAIAISLGLTLLFFGPIFARWTNWGIEDWDQHAFYHEAARVSLLKYHQIPQWNPYYCGGTDLLANPQSRALGPTFPFILLFGTVGGLKIEMMLFAAIGMLGIYALGRSHGLDRVCAWLAPIVCFLGPFYALPMSSGMTWVLSTAYIPWIVLAYERWANRKQSIVLSAAGLALMYLGGGVYPVAVTLLFIGLLTLFSLRRSSIGAPLLTAGAVVAVMLTLGAAKFFPSIAFMREFPRHVDKTYGFSLQSLTYGLFDRDQRLEAARTQFDASSHNTSPDSLLRGISSDFDDVGMYIGPVVAALSLCGLLAYGRSLWKLAAAVPIFLWLSAGDRARFTPFALLQRLPVYDSFRYPERFRLIWFLILCLFAGCGVQWVRDRVSTRFGVRAGLILVTAIIALVATDLFAVTRPIYRAAFPIPPLATIEFADFRQIRALPSYDEHGFTKVADEIYGSWSAHYPALLMNLGAVECYETAIVPRRAVPMGSPAYRGEAHLDGAEGTVTTAYWSPNVLRFTVDAKAPATLVVNQNYYGNWRAVDGRPVTSRDGLISVAVDPQDHSIELRYGRRSFTSGLLVSAIAWMVAAVVLVRAKVRR